MALDDVKSHVCQEIELENDCKILGQPQKIGERHAG